MKNQKVNPQKLRYDKELKLEFERFNKYPEKLKLPSVDFFLNDYDAFHMNKFFARFIKKINFSGKNILDFGCGSGILTTFFALKKAKYSFGVDISKKAIEISRLRSKVNNVKAFFFLTNSGGKIDLIKFKKKFDYIFIIAVLHHLTESQVETLFTQIKLILKSNGKIFINEPISFSDKITKFIHIIPIKPRPSILSKNYKPWYHKVQAKLFHDGERIIRPDLLIYQLKKNEFKIEKIKYNRFLSQLSRIFKSKLLSKIFLFFDSLFLNLPIFKLFARNITIIARK